MPAAIRAAPLENGVPVTAENGVVAAPHVEVDACLAVFSLNWERSTDTPVGYTGGAGLRGKIGTPDEGLNQKNKLDQLAVSTGRESEGLYQVWFPAVQGLCKHLILFDIIRCLPRRAQSVSGLGGRDNYPNGEICGT